MRIFTLLCHGTNFNRYGQNELISELGRLLEGEEAKIDYGSQNDFVAGDYLILEGPGSAPQSGQSDAPTPGTVNPFSPNVPKEEMNEVITGNWQRARGRVQENIRGDRLAFADSIHDYLNRHQNQFSSWIYTAQLLRNRYFANERVMLDAVLELVPQLDRSKNGPELAAAIGRAVTASVKSAMDPELERRETFFREFHGDVLGANWATTGLLRGSGWEDNVLRAVAIIANLKPLPDIINIVGWSRGAVTAIKIANKLFEVFGREITLTLFLVDPVYGGGVSHEDADALLPKNVKEFVVILSMHDTRTLFAPQDARVLRYDRHSTYGTFLPMPGAHSTQVQIGSDPVDGAGKVTWSIAIRHLLDWGTRLKSQSGAYLLSLQELAVEYARMWTSMEQYQESEGGKWGWDSTRDFMRHLSEYVSDANVFINRHHRNVFAHAYPQAYSVLFGPTPQSLTLSMIQTLENLPDQIHAWLAGCGLITRNHVRLNGVEMFGRDRIVPTRLSPTLHLPGQRVSAGSIRRKMYLGKYD